MTLLTASDLTVDLRDPAPPPRREVPDVAFPATLPVELIDDDVSFLLELLSDPTIAWYEPLAVPVAHPSAIQMVRSYIRKSSDPAGETLGWALLESGVRVGVCQLRREDDGYLVGASLFPAVRGRGLGTAIFKALALYGFHNLGAGHVAGEVEDDNTASIRALSKASYVPVSRYPTTLDNGRLAIRTRYEAGA
jgi:RimJ/RimL family protein N-acetyltransferase